MRKDGGPDLRYKHNSSLPVVEYPEVHLSCAPVLNFRFYVSNAILAGDFVRELARYAARKNEYERGTAGGDYSSTGRSSSGRDEYAGERLYSAAQQDPYAVLGVRPGASEGQINAAYRKMAQQYHPDKVAALGPRLREVAESEMKKINAAYELVMSRLRRSL